MGSLRTIIDRWRVVSKASAYKPMVVAQLMGLLQALPSIASIWVYGLC